MPQKKSAAKALRQTKKRTIRNKKIKDNIKNLIKRSRKAIEAGVKDQALDFVKQAIKAIDKAARKKILKKNAAARKKSRLMKKINAIKK